MQVEDEFGYGWRIKAIPPLKSTKDVRASMLSFTLLCCVGLCKEVYEIFDGMAVPHAHNFFTGIC